MGRTGREDNYREQTLKKGERMSKYERFIIYPLLIMALVYGFILNPGIAARPETETFERIVAREIIVPSAEGQIQMKDGSLMIVDENHQTFGVILPEGIGFRDGERGYTLSVTGSSFKNQYGITVLELTVDDEGHGRLRILDKDGENERIFDLQEHGRD